MPLKFSSSGLAINTNTSVFLSFIDSVLRGVGQVFLQNNSYTGLLFLIGIFCHSTLFGCAVLVGTVISTMTAMLFGADKDQVKDGLFGFNGALVGVALMTFLQPSGFIWGYTVFASACSSIVMASALRLFNVWKMPTLTAPFVITTLGFLLASTGFGKLHSPNILPDAVTIEEMVTTSSILEGLLKGVAQVFFQDNIITGIFFIIGLFVSSKRASMMAILGSLSGLLIAWGLGASEPAMSSGLSGFNPVLTAVAMGGFFTVLNAGAIIYILISITATVITTAAVSAALAPLALPPLTLPFVLVVWIFVMAKDLFFPLKKS